MPRSKLLILLICLVAAGCSNVDEQTAPGVTKTTESGISGLYERAGRTGAPDRLCLADDKAGLRFGLATRGDGPGNCTARGTAIRQGATLQLRIDGAPACSIAATTSEAGVTLGAAKGAECDYYCGEGAELTGGLFARTGSTSTDLKKAVDVAGEPLC